MKSLMTNKNKRLSYKQILNSFVASLIITCIRSYLDFKTTKLDIMNELFFLIVCFVVIYISVIVSVLIGDSNKEEM